MKAYFIYCNICNKLLSRLPIEYEKYEKYLEYIFNVHYHKRPVKMTNNICDCNFINEHPNIKI